MKINILIPIGITLGMCVIYSCSKKDSGSFKEGGSVSSSQAAAGKNGNVSAVESLPEDEVLVPTRKAVEYRTTDTKTGKSSVYYTCTDPGDNCDVGETPDPGKPGTMIPSPHEPTRIKTIEFAIGKESAQILEYFDAEKEKLENLFPKVYQAREAIASGELKLTADDSYIAIVQNNEEAHAIVVYETNDKIALDKTLPIPVGRFRAAKINTQTGIIECLDEGYNCTIAYAGGYRISHNIYLQLIDKEFEGLGLSEAVVNKQYEIFETKECLQLKPANGEGENYYFLR